MSEGSFFDFNLEEAAAYCRLKPSYIYQNIRRIDHFKVAGRLWFKREALEKFLAEGLVTSGRLSPR